MDGWVLTWMLLSAVAWIAAGVVIFIALAKQAQAKWRMAGAATAAALLALLMAYVAGWSFLGVSVTPTAMEQGEDPNQAALRALRSQAADVQFAEDDAGDDLDVAGLSEAELEVYGDTVEGYSDAAPAGSDASLPEYLQGRDQTREAGKQTGEAQTVEKDDQPTARHLSPANYSRTRALVAINRNATWLVLLGVLLAAAWKYLAGFHRIIGGSPPWPIAGPIGDLASKSMCWRSPTSNAAAVRDVLERSVCKNEPFVLLAGGAAVWSDDPPTAMPRLRARRRSCWMMPLHVFHDASSADAGEFDWAFELAWFGRGSVVAGDEQSSQAMLDAIVDRMNWRSQSRARARRTVNVVCVGDTWPAAFDASLLSRLGDANIRVIVCSEADPPAAIFDRFEVVSLDGFADESQADHDAAAAAHAATSPVTGI